ncbi:hypothetical protein SAOR_04805 [Salinisphaera orenii MK-B5]|uniref:Uncharacterized protein n=1 Tax=Salinisphaera orenii MK-B5 TaxID=856730 RepID=A0A423PTH9_9GAMM|nr:hypothetical protein SAOR_04805 [Salinisphaera orenii MK-B5]
MTSVVSFHLNFSAFPSPQSAKYLAHPEIGTILQRIVIALFSEA